MCGTVSTSGCAVAVPPGELLVVDVVNFCRAWHARPMGTSTSLRLAIDLDGVVANFNDGWTRLHNEEFGGNLSADLVTMWDGLHKLGGFANMDDFWTWAEGGDRRPSVFRHLDVFPGAIETLNSLDDSGHEIVIVSTKPDWAVHETLHWLAERAIPTREIHFSFRKYEVDCDVYLDDAPHVLQELVEHHPDSVVCRFVRPWNRPVEGTHDVHDWTGFQRVVNDVCNRG